ncbi:MAG: tRNA (adenosine(37)-N6)-dimethylallyltransferase MiaA [Phycisphaerae bacterium]|nr:tRNA (adenosine(37)-N6)-dimethylallyltransferase MiaA [Phycisphaerae bacterium]
MTAAPTIVALIGCTAAGKSAISIELAKRLGGEILTVDSMQVYCGMDIGTAKPTASERDQIIHHLLDVAAPNEEFTVARFVRMADAIIAESERPLIATGGTPMFFKALFEGLFEGPSADPERRERIAREPAHRLHARLVSVDPQAAARIHANDTRRIVRALEVYELTGRPISSFQEQWGAATRHPAKWFGLAWEKETLNRRINARVKQMIEAGWVDEVRALLAEYGQLSKTAGKATGYAELIKHIHDECPLDVTIEEIKIATRQLARRQLKWFRRFPNVQWLNGDQSPARLADTILQAVQCG